jgi:hypothetical protein
MTVSIPVFRAKQWLMIRARGLPSQKLSRIWREQFCAKYFHSENFEKFQAGDAGWLDIVSPQDA